MTTPADRPILAKVSRLVCLALRHRPVRTITGVTVDEWSPLGGLRGQITGSRVDCQRCGKELEPA